MKKSVIAPPVIARMPKYYRCVDELFTSNCVRVSSTTLSQRLGFTASQIRQDFSCFGEFGQQGYGYNVKKLRFEIQEILGMNNRHTAILVGCGNIGHALLKNFDFARCGFELIGAFDKDPTVAGTEMNGHVILIDRELPGFIEALHPTVAVLTVPRDVAQGLAEFLVERGVYGLWNFTNCDLKIKNPAVRIENVVFSDSLLKLSYMISSEQD